MRHSNIFVLSTLLATLATACAQPVDDEAAPAQQATAADVLFPDDTFLPRDSCDLGVAIDCPGRQTYTLTHVANLRTGAQTTESFTQSMTATVDRSTISCRAPDFITTASAGVAFLPSGVTATVTQSRASVVFSKAIADETGSVVCGFDCTAGGAVPRNCAQSRLTNATFQGILTVNGQSRNVQLTSQVSGNPTPNPSTRRLEVQCQLTLPGSSMTTNVRARPNDVISASGNRFVRGYALTGSALTGACSRLANLSCQPSSGEQHLDGLGQCIQANTDQCVRTFSNADPCVAHPIPPIH